MVVFFMGKKLLDADWGSIPLFPLDPPLPLL